MGRHDGGGCAGCLVSLAVFGLAFAVLSLLTLVFVAIGYVLYQIAVYLFRPQPRLFGAYPMSRWAMSFDAGLFLLEDRSGIDFNSTPMRTLSGVLMLTLAPLIILSWVMMFFSPTWLWILPGVGLVLSVGTSAMLTSGPELFWASGSGTTSVEDILEAGAVSSLEIEDW